MSQILTKHTVLFELGSEELPPKSLKTLRDALKAEIIKGLNEVGLNFDSVDAYAAPRRLAIKINNIDAAQADTQKRFDGPALQAAYDGQGQPTKALEGFMRGQGIQADQLATFQVGKVEKVGYYKDIKGQSLEALLPNILQKALDNLPIAKRMRSAASRTEFVRPVKWVVLLKDDQVIQATLQDHQSANVSYGHRFHAPQAIHLKHANDYLPELEQAFVIADFEKRQAAILAQVKTLSDEVNATAIIPDDLLDEVTSLVEWPVALRATFEARYLAVPQEALITTMQDNQKYFCLVNSDGKLQPYFITVANIESKDPAQIIAGNEKVVRPRLSDAEFFFLQDQKISLASRQDKLANMVFQAELGTLWDKSTRIAKLASQIAHLIGSDALAAEQAGLIAKSDLTSELVGEFPELQGIAGTYYARIEGLPDEVASAIAEQYLPRFAGDILPQTRTGIALALADRLDTLVGIFGIGQAPTGSKDPFSLRRAAIGVLRLLIEKQLNLSLAELTKLAAENYHGQLREPVKAQHEALNFIEARYRAMYEDQGMAVDVIQSVQALSPKSPLDFDNRIKAVNHFKGLIEAEALAAANKRVANILAKEGQIQGEIREDLLVEAAEKALFSTLKEITPVVEPLLEAHDYTEALSKLAALRAPIDAFFDNVMVMAEDTLLKANRLRLLAQLRRLFTAVADVSMLQP